MLITVNDVGLHDVNKCRCSDIGIGINTYTYLRKFSKLKVN